MALISDWLREWQQTGDKPYKKKEKYDVTEYEPLPRDLDHIHNTDGYFKLNQRNTRRFNDLNKILHRRYGVYFHEEVLKEIALEYFFKTKTLNDIDHILTKYEGIKTIEDEDDDL